ncbi:MAG: replication-associated recombination protein A [Pseudomonadales bacterium]|nr:replication-associated recombination protein A [Pseudomonadales bacterium]
MRPRRLEDYVGQSHILGPGKPLREALKQAQLHSMIFWGPPGVGKTTLALMLAENSGAHFESLSAVLSGVKDIRAAVDKARLMRQQDGRATILFVDEVHRFNKSQQDAFLPHIENGTLVFIGASTENPSFEINNALLSRTRVYVLKPLTEAELLQLIQRALMDEATGLGGRKLMLSEENAALLARAADGDGRRVLNLLELAADLAVEQEDEGVRLIDDTVLEQVLQGSGRRFDKGGDSFYEQISALHKAVRGSSPDAALYWTLRMLDGGCDPLYIARRLVRMASEDIGNADPRCLQIALSAWDAIERLGSPEGELSLAQAVIYLACAPKSNAVYLAFQQAATDVNNNGSLEVPLHLRNAATQMMKNMQYGEEYRYAHDEAGGYAAGENYFPEALADARYYFPVNQGLEQKIREKLDYLRTLDQKSAKKRYTSRLQE